MSISHPVIIPLSPSPSGIPVFLFRTCALTPASITPWVGATILSTSYWFSSCASTVACTPYPVVCYSIGTSSSSYPTPQAPSVDPSSVHLPSSSSFSSTCPPNLRNFSMYAPPASMAWSDAGAHQALLYSDRVACTSPSIPGTNMSHIFILLYTSISILPVTNSKYLVRRIQIISPMIIGQTPGALSRANR